jgi:hypothetical protein
MRRFILFRTTAFPTAFDTTTPTLAPPLFASMCTTSVGRPTRTPSRTVALKSAADRSRASAGNTFRQRVCYGLCGAAQKRLPVRHGSASAVENHGSEHGAGYSAGTYAWSQVTPCRKHIDRLLPMLTMYAVDCAFGQARVTRMAHQRYVAHRFWSSWPSTWVTYCSLSNQDCRGALP